MPAQVLIETAIPTHSDRLDVQAELQTTTDGSLLAEVAAGSGTESFHKLVQRHSTMVLAACQRQLGDTHAAEDAAQAVFLVLWQKARSLRRRKSVAGWLHHVARNVCRNAKRARQARQRHEQQAAEMSSPTAETQNEWGEVKEILDEEIDRLAEKYRLPVILFHLQGRSQEEIAAMLNTKPATIATRLRRAREILNSRLTRRGVSVAVGGLLATLTTQASVAAPSTAFVASTTQAVTLMSAGNLTAAATASAPSVALAKGAMSMLTMAKIQTAAVVATTAAVVATTTAVVVHSTLAEPEVPAPIVKELPPDETPVRVLWKHDRLQQLQQRMPLDNSLVTVAARPDLDDAAMNQFAATGELKLQPATAGDEAVAVLVSPTLDTGKFWRPTRVHRDEQRITLVAEWWTDNEARKRNMHRQSMYVVGLGKLEAGEYSLDLHVREMFRDAGRRVKTPQYVERAVLTASTHLVVPDQEAAVKEAGVASIGADALKSGDGNGGVYQRIDDTWPAYAGGPRVPTIHYLDFKEGMDGLLKSGHSSVGSYDFANWNETPKTNADYSLPRYHPPTVGMPVCLRVQSTYMGLSDLMTLREVEWIGAKKIVVRLDMWRDGVAAADDYPRMPVLLLPVYKGTLPLHEPGDYEVQIEWNLWYDDHGKVYRRITLDDLHDAELPNEIKASYKYMATEQIGLKFTLNPPKDVADGPEDPTAQRLKLLKQDPKSYRLTLKSYREQDELGGFMWLEVLHSSPPPQNGSQTTTYLNEKQVLRLVDALARDGYLRRGQGGEAKLGKNSGWVLRIANSKFAQFQVLADDKSGEATRQALLKLIAEAKTDDAADAALFDPKRRDAAPVVVRLKKIETQGRELGRLHYYGRVESVIKYDLKNLPTDSIRVRDSAPPKDATGLKNVYFIGRLGEGDEPLPEGCSATVYIGGFAEGVWHLHGSTIGKGISHVVAADDADDEAEAAEDEHVIEAKIIRTVGDWIAKPIAKDGFPHAQVMQGWVELNGELTDVMPIGPRRGGRTVEAVITAREGDGGAGVEIQGKAIAFDKKAVSLEGANGFRTVVRLTQHDDWADHYLALRVGNGEASAKLTDEDQVYALWINGLKKPFVAVEPWIETAIGESREPIPQLQADSDWTALTEEPQLLTGVLDRKGGFELEFKAAVKPTRATRFEVVFSGKGVDGVAGLGLQTKEGVEAVLPLVSKPDGEKWYIALQGVPAKGDKEEDAEAKAKPNVTLRPMLRGATTIRHPRDVWTFEPGQKINLDVLRLNQGDAPVVLRQKILAGDIEFEVQNKTADTPPKKLDPVKVMDKQINWQGNLVHKPLAPADYVEVPPGGGMSSGWFEYMDAKGQYAARNSMRVEIPADWVAKPGVYELHVTYTATDDKAWTGKVRSAPLTFEILSPERIAELEKDAALTREDARTKAVIAVETMYRNTWDAHRAANKDFKDKPEGGGLLLQTRETRPFQFVIYEDRSYWWCQYSVSAEGMNSTMQVEVNAKTGEAQAKRLVARCSFGELPRLLPPGEK